MESMGIKEFGKNPSLYLKNLPLEITKNSKVIAVVIEKELYDKLVNGIVVVNEDKTIVFDRSKDAVTKFAEDVPVEPQEVKKKPFKMPDTWTVKYGKVV